MSDLYAAEELSLTFTFKEWAAILSCMETVRDEKHDRADRIEADDLDGKRTEQIDGLRKRASYLFDLMEDITAGLKDIRVGVAIARRAGAA